MHKNQSRRTSLQKDKVFQAYRFFEAYRFLCNKISAKSTSTPSVSKTRTPRVKLENSAAKTRVKKEPRNLPAPPKFEIFNDEEKPKPLKIPIPKINISSSSTASVSASAKKTRTKKKPKASDDDWKPETPVAPPGNPKLARKTRATARRLNKDREEVLLSTRNLSDSDEIFFQCDCCQDQHHFHL